MTLHRHLRIMAGGTEDAPVSLPTLKVAFATTDRKHVDQHFGSAKRFVIYGVCDTQATVIEFAEFEDQAQDGHEDKLPAKLKLLEGCAAVYCQAVGGSAIRQLLARKVQPIRVDADTPIDQLLQTLMGELRTGSSTWLVKKGNAKQTNADATRFDAMEAEGWQE